MSKRIDDFIDYMGSPEMFARILAGGIIFLSSVVAIGGAVRTSKNIKETKEYHEEMSLENEEKYEDVYKAYDCYIDLIANEIRESDMNNSSMEVFAAYTTLEQNGWISLGDEFTYGEADFEPIGNLGISVALGEGVGRNQAFNLFRVFDSLGYECGVVYGNIYSDLPSNENSHAVTYVKDGKHLFLYDPTNKTVFLRDFWGHFVSIDDENFKFNPNMNMDDKYGQLTDNSAVYLYFSEDYGSYITYETRRRKALEKASLASDYYREYENEHLLRYEREIDEERNKQAGL